MEDKFKNVAINPIELCNWVMMEADTRFHDDYYNFLYIDDETGKITVSESVKPYNKIYLHPDFIKKIVEKADEKSLSQIEHNWKASLTIHNLEFGHEVQVPGHIKRLLYEGKLDRVDTETLITLCEAVDKS